MLLEAGGRNEDEAQRIDGKRWTTFMQAQMNWGYKTTPQEHCNNRQIDYSRGKGLGGGSAINFGVYTVGARDDYDQWAADVADETFGWKQMQARFKKLETFAGEIDDVEQQRFARPDAADHGDAGGLKVGYAKEWETDLPLVLDALEKAGLPRNLDHNSGNPLGMSLMINSASKGRRTTATDLFVGIPDNLVVVTESPVQRVVVQGKKAVGVEVNGKQCKLMVEMLFIPKSNAHRSGHQRSYSVCWVTRYASDHDALGDRSSRRTAKVQYPSGPGHTSHRPGPQGSLLRATDSRPQARNQ